MRISINARKMQGPYGGAHQFANALDEYLRSKGHTVLRKLVPNLDLILVVCSQSDRELTAYDMDGIRDYVCLNANTVVIHRVNSCDEQRGSDLGINDAILKANRFADYTIFISSFVGDVFMRKGMEDEKPHCVILNGADEHIFNPSGRAGWTHGQKLRIVTHHWSTNFMKGFDIYERLDQLLENEPFKSRFEFTYIGRVPTGVFLERTRMIPPATGGDLADLLRQHHVYLTAARNEAGGMHHIEGMRCGLPVLYLKSGALPEYCLSYGMEFTLINFEQRLLEMYGTCGHLREKVLECPYSGSWMAAQYEEVFRKVMAKRRTNPRPRRRLTKVFQLHLVTRPYRRLELLRELTGKAVRYLRSK